MAYITLSKSAFFHNLDQIARQSGGLERIALVLKDNAYGHGLDTMASLAHAFGVRRAIVRDQAEAKVIEKYFDYVLVLAEIPLQHDEKIHYTINALDQIRRFPRGTLVELKVDTGMHRNGIAFDELEAAFRQVIEAGLVLKGIFTHQRSADTLGSEWHWQQKNFEAVKAKAHSLAVELGLERPSFHSANSATLYRSGIPEDESVVRVGIAAYGCLAMDRTLDQPLLRPVMSLWAQKIATRTLNTGARVGYNGAYAAAASETVSTYDIGYADGLPRALSNRLVTPNGNHLLGRVSMDNISLSGESDEVLLFDDANVIASQCDTIGYEILVSMRRAMPRKVID
jgi:alanine racemase